MWGWPFDLIANVSNNPNALNLQSLASNKISKGLVPFNKYAWLTPVSVLHPQGPGALLGAATGGTKSFVLSAQAPHLFRPTPAEARKIIGVRGGLELKDPESSDFAKQICQPRTFLPAHWSCFDMFSVLSRALERVIEVKNPIAQSRVSEDSQLQRSGNLSTHLQKEAERFWCKPKVIFPQSQDNISVCNWSIGFSNSAMVKPAKTTTKPQWFGSCFSLCRLQ